MLFPTTSIRHSNSAEMSASEQMKAVSWSSVTTSHLSLVRPSSQMLFNSLARFLVFLRNKSNKIKQQNKRGFAQRALFIISKCPGMLQTGMKDGLGTSNLALKITNADGAHRLFSKKKSFGEDWKFYFSSIQDNVLLAKQ